MPDRPDDTEPVLGRSLAETALLNSREHRAGRRAAASVRRPRRSPESPGSRAVLRGWLWLLGVIATVGLVAWALEVANVP